MIKIKQLKSNNAVSEVVGTILLLGIAVALFSVLYYMVLAEPFETNNPYPSIATYVEGGNIVIEHRGGNELGADSHFEYTIGGKAYHFTMKDLIQGTEGAYLEDINSDEKWNFGERIIIPYDASLDNSIANLQGSDSDENRVSMDGMLDIFPENDIGIEVQIDNDKPGIWDFINIAVIIHNYGGDLNATNVNISFKLPIGLRYNFHSFVYGPDYDESWFSYDSETGFCLINTIKVRDSITLLINVTVTDEIAYREKTQLIMILDGSSSITDDNWNLMVTGLSNAVKNSSIFPYDESVELTVIQFGERDPPRARLEIGPIIVTKTNSNTIANDILNINQMVDRWWEWEWHLGSGWVQVEKRLGYTPMDCGLRLAADIAAGIHPDGSNLFDQDIRQVVNLVTDGKPNCEWISDTYNATYVHSYSRGKVSTELARTYLLNTLQMDETQDEFDCLAIGDGPDLSWLKEHVVWPPPGYEAPPYDNGPGWVNHTLTFEDFEKAITEMFRIQFSTIKSKVELNTLDSRDSYSKNDFYPIIINPQE